MEAAWQNTFEILSYMSTIVFPSPAQFQWPSLISMVAVIVAAAMYAVFVRRERGHLLHKVDILRVIKRKESIREAGLRRIASGSDV